MKLSAVVETSSAVASTSKRLEKIARLAALLRRLTAAEVPVAIGFLTGWPHQGKLGVGWATVSAAREREPALDDTLTLEDVDGVFDQLVAATGTNSGNRRAQLTADLFARATADEQRFLGALIVGEVRQGALESVLLDAVAQAADMPSAAVRRAVMLAGDLGGVARQVLSAADDATRAAALREYQLQLFRPVQPMLADSAATVRDALVECIGSGIAALLEWKLDGARIQVHRDEDRVAVYTRNLNDVTARLPEVRDAVLQLPARRIILDGEVIALAASGRPHSFQVTMRRFGKKLEDDDLRAALPLTPFFFDVLLFDDETLIDAPLSERVALLDRTVPSSLRVPRTITADPDDAERLQAEALAAGHEGVMVKSLTAPYAAGRRGSAWIKVKKPRSLDLVVLAAEWGSGRRRGWLSNLHLGARDPATGDFIMLGKTFKGMTDELLAWQTTELLAREARRDGHVVYVRPELVVEIAFNEVQESSQYPGGVALRFARVKGYRPDKHAGEADTIDAVRAFLPSP